MEKCMKNISLLKEHKIAPHNDVINKNNFIFQFFPFPLPPPDSQLTHKCERREKLSQKVLCCSFFATPRFRLPPLPLSNLRRKNTALCFALDDDRWVWEGSDLKRIPEMGFKFEALMILIMEMQDNCGAF